MREWSKLRPWRSLASLGLEYVCVFLVAGLAVGFHLFRQERGLHPAWEAPVLAAAVFVIGILQNRIALLGHESSHYLLLPDRAWNDRLANLLIFHPLFSDIRLYRKRHLGHHLHPNDSRHDPNLHGGKAERIWARFPMARGAFARGFYLMFFWPPFVLRNLLDLFLTLTMGKRTAGESGARRVALAGRAWFVLMSLVVVVSAWRGESCLPVLAGMAVAALAVWASLPVRMFGEAGGASSADCKWSALLKLCFNMLLLLVCAEFSRRFGGIVIVGFLVLWVFPLMYVFPYLMLLREIYQHANAGTGDLDNTRIMHVDPFTRWALLAYGNDFHLVHHLYPCIPHDRLEEVHGVLLRESAEYAAAMEETHGVVSAPRGRRSILDALAK